MKKILALSVLLSVLTLSSVSAVSVENAGNTSTVMGGNATEITNTEVDLLIERTSGRIIVTLFLVSPVDLAGGGFNLKVPQGVEFERAARVQNPQGPTALQNDPDAIQNEDFSVDVEFVRLAPGEVSGEILQLVFVDNPNAQGTFELQSSEDNYLTVNGGEDLFIIGEVELITEGVNTTVTPTPSPTQTNTQTPSPTTQTATQGDTSTPQVGTTTPTTEATTQVQAETATGSSALSEVAAEETETETGLTTNILLFVIAAFLLLGFIVSRRREV